MAEMTNDEQREIERLAFEFLRNAYCNLATIVKLAKPKAAACVFAGLELRMADCLREHRHRQPCGDHTELVLFEAGLKICAVLDEAHSCDLVDVAT